MSHLFTVYSQKTKTLRITSCNLEILSVRKRALTEGELSWSSKERPPSSTTNQLLRNKIQGLDAWFHVTDLEKALKLDWTCTPFVDPKINNSQNWSMWHLMRQIPKLFGPGLLEICQQNSDDDTILQMISSVYDLDDIWTLDKKKMPECSPVYLITCDFNRLSISALSFWCEELLPEKSFLAWRDQNHWNLKILLLLSNAVRKRSCSKG